MILKWLKEPIQILRTGGNHTSLSLANIRTPMGHPEGYLDAASPHTFDYPGINDGVHGMAIIEGLVENHQSDEKWLTINN
ncbi:hypothetical protein ESZ36_13225 [Colwellia demingiae]|uniref:Uncharacterized protein n=1 Tax=Colwellia demingiae TaxID=89401 RepID=A0A5C6QF57_9GAMM|nr:hypothetical protein [Colwellia demingiae]TWX67262.1 hypothetical protein ESZ36_13225 [Colwellia demingiae]